MISVSIEALALSREFAVRQVAAIGGDTKDFEAQLVAQLFGQGALGAGAERSSAAEPSAPSFTAAGFAQAFERLR